MCLGSIFASKVLVAVVLPFSALCEYNRPMSLSSDGYHKLSLGKFTWFSKYISGLCLGCSKPNTVNILDRIVNFTEKMSKNSLQGNIGLKKAMFRMTFYI